MEINQVVIIDIFPNKMLTQNISPLRDFRRVINFFLGADRFHVCVKEETQYFIQLNFCKKKAELNRSEAGVKNHFPK